MLNYLIRVQLAAPYPSDAYTALHDGMKRYGFDRIIQGQKGWYHLPNAEYYGKSSLDAETLYNVIFGLVRPIDADPLIFVSQVGDLAWRLTPL